MGYFFYVFNGIKGVHSHRFCRFLLRFFPLKGAMLARKVTPSVTPTVTPTPFFCYFSGSSGTPKVHRFYPLFCRSSWCRLTPHLTPR